MTAKYTEIRDAGPNPNTPTVEEMRASQEAGSKGIGTNSESYCELQAAFGADHGDVSDSGKPEDFNHAATPVADADEADEYNAGVSIFGRK